MMPTARHPTGSTANTHVGMPKTRHHRATEYVRTYRWSVPTLCVLALTAPPLGFAFSPAWPAVAHTVPIDIDVLIWMPATAHHVEGSSEAISGLSHSLGHSLRLREDRRGLRALHLAQPWAHQSNQVLDDLDTGCAILPLRSSRRSQVRSVNRANAADGLSKTDQDARRLQFVPRLRHVEVRSRPRAIRADSAFALE